MDDLAPFCCLNSRCPDFGRRGAGNLTVTGRLGKARQYRLLYCRTCRARFSERKGTPLYRAHSPEVVVTSILDHIHEGCGVLKTARLVNPSSTTSRTARAAAAAGAVVLGAGEADVAGPPCHRVAQVMQDAGEDPVPGAGLPAERTGPMHIIATARDELRGREHLGIGDAQSGVRRVDSRTTHDNALPSQSLFSLILRLGPGFFIP